MITYYYISKRVLSVVSNIKNSDVCTFYEYLVCQKHRCNYIYRCCNEYVMSLDNATHRISHRIRMEIKAKANNRRLFFGENGNPLILCSRRIDKGGPGQCYIKMSFV